MAQHSQERSPEELSIEELLADYEFALREDAAEAMRFDYGRVGDPVPCPDPEDPQIEILRSKVIRRLRANEGA